MGALLYLADKGFFSSDDIGEAFMRGMDQLPEEMPRAARRVAEVIGNFRTAAD